MIQSILLLAAAGGAGGGAAPAPLRAFIPNSLLRQGEVRVVETPAAVTLQTILYTRFPGRVIETICGKEEKSWPPGSACREDSQAYCRALRAVPRLIEEGGRGGAYRWMIEFSAGPAAARVEFSEIAASGPREDLSIERARSLPAPAVSEAYIRKNMALILLDMFGAAADHEPAIARILRRLEEAK